MVKSLGMRKNERKKGVEFRDQKSGMSRTKRQRLSEIVSLLSIGSYRWSDSRVAWGCV